MSILLASIPKTILVVGSGSIAIKHLSFINAVFPDCAPISVPSRSKVGYHQPAACLSFDSLEHALDYPIDVAIVASPATSHIEHIRLLATKKIPLLIEKPIAATVKDANALKALVEQQSITARVGYCLRFLPATQMIRKLLVNQHLGDIISVSAKVAQYLPSWRANIDYKNSVSAQQKLGGGALLELSHELDLIRYLFGAYNVLGCSLYNSGTLGIDVEEVAHLLFELTHGARVNVELNFVQQFTERYMVITGSLATLKWDLLTHSVLLYRHGQSSPEILSDSAGESMYHQQLRQFPDAMSGEITAHATVTQACEVVNIIEQCKTLASANTGIQP